jgi:DNA-binding Lrp family transcriptional regulator
MAEHLPSEPTGAFVLINVEPARTREVLERLRAIPGALVREVLGSYDIVLEVETEAPEYLTHIVREKVRPVPGVLTTTTLTWID